MFSAHAPVQSKDGDTMDIDAPEQLRGSALMFERQLAQLSNMNLNDNEGEEQMDLA